MALTEKKKMRTPETSSRALERDPLSVGADLRERLLSFGWFERKAADSVRFITDHAGSVPLYYAQGQDRVLAGATPFEVAKQACAVTFDPVSVADFLLNGTVCYPYTLFKGVFAVPPGAVTEVTPYNVNSVAYYRPEEQESSEPAAYWGLHLRERVQKTLLAGLEGKKNIKVLFSGGEDSRAIVSLLPADIECELITFADSYNREVRLAHRAARALGRPLRFARRPEGFYRQSLPERMTLIGGIADVRHTHVFGALADALSGADAIVGGFTADTLFKSLWKNNIESGLLRISPEKLRDTHTSEPAGVEWLRPLSWIDRKIAEESDARRWALHEEIKQFRPTTAGNWNLMWPLATQQPHYAHHLATKALRAEVVEPFLSPQVYSLAATMPDAFRADRRAFRAAFGRTMGKAGWLPTSSGRIPRLGGYLGHWVEFGTVASRRLRDRSAGMLNKVRGRLPKNQGAWSGDHGDFRHEHLLKFGDSRSEGLRELLTQILSVKDANKFWDREGGATAALARNRLLQISYLMDE